MADRRMFSNTIIDSDAFLDMPATAQLLYFHLCMRADDEGFINNPKRIMRDIRCSDDDMKMLIAKKYVLPFESGVIVIRHWRLHNYIRKDRKKPSTCEERNLICLNDNGVYELLSDDHHDSCQKVVRQLTDNMSTTCQPCANHVTDNTSTKWQRSIGKNRIDKNRSVECRLEDEDNGQADGLSQNLLDFYQDNIEILTPFKVDDLQSMLEDFGEEWLRKAMEKLAGCEVSKRNNRYLRGILNGWKKTNVPKPWESTGKGKDAKSKYIKCADGTLKVRGAW